MEVIKSKKQKDEVELKRKVFTLRIIFYPILLTSIAFLVAGGVVSSKSFLGAGAALFLINIVFRISMSIQIRELKRRIKRYCPKCDTSMLFHINTANEDTGTYKKTFAMTGQNEFYEKLIRTTKYFKCLRCGYETQSVIISTHPDY